MWDIYVIDTLFYKITKAIFHSKYLLKMCYFELVSQEDALAKSTHLACVRLLRLCHLDSQPGCMEWLLSLGLSFQGPNFLAQFRFKDVSDNNIWQFQNRKGPKPNWIEKSHRVSMPELAGKGTRQKKKTTKARNQECILYTWGQLGLSFPPCNLRRIINSERKRTGYGCI